MITFLWGVDCWEECWGSCTDSVGSGRKGSALSRRAVDRLCYTSSYPPSAWICHSLCAFKSRGHNIRMWPAAVPSVKAFQAKKATLFFFFLLRNQRVLLNKVNSHSAALRRQVRTKADELVNIELVINLGHPTLSSTHPSLAPETGRKNNNPTVNK